MSALSLLLNVLWIVFGGLWMAVGWIIAAVRTEHRTGQAFYKWLECPYWVTDSPKATSR